MNKQTNITLVVGNLVKVPEMRTTPTGISVCSFTIGNNRDYKTKDGEEIKKVNYFNCTAWGKLGEVIGKHFTQGQQILVSGELEQKSWNDKEGNKRYSVELLVNGFEFMGFKGDKSGSSENESPEYE